MSQLVLPFEEKQERTIEEELESAIKEIQALSKRHARLLMDKNPEITPYEAAMAVSLGTSVLENWLLRGSMYFQSANPRLDKLKQRYKDEFQLKARTLARIK